VGDKVASGAVWPWLSFEEIKGKNIVYVAGGIGLIPLRSSIVHVLQHKQEFGRVIVLHGARTPDDLMYKENLKEWQAFPGFETYITVDVQRPVGPVRLFCAYAV